MTKVPEKPETEEDGIRAEALRRSKVRLLSLVPPAPIRGSSTSQSSMPATTGSTSADRPSSQK